ncbi:MAG: FHA domain-containing protein [Chloroflexi bacterium]|nr:FHA domain-containing protein [Chloroflexota bacterium]
MSEWIFLGLRTILAITLYAFLGWSLWLIWRDLRHQQYAYIEQKINPINIRLELEGDIQEKHFASTEVVIGRDPNCACVILSNTVSAHHTRLSFHHQQWWAEDLDSTNGTLLNDEIITESVVLTPGDQLRCGDAMLTILPINSESQDGSDIN